MFELSLIFTAVGCAGLLFSLAFLFERPLVKLYDKFDKAMEEMWRV